MGGAGGKAIQKCVAELVFRAIFEHRGPFLSAFNWVGQTPMEGISADVAEACPALHELCQVLRLWEGPQALESGEWLVAGHPSSSLALVRRWLTHSSLMSMTR